MMKPTLWLLAFTLLFAGCTPDNDVPCAEPFTGSLAEEEIPLSGTWELTALEGSTAIDLTDDDIDNASTDLYAQIDECVVNVKYILNDSRVINYVASEVVEDFCEERVLLDGTWKYELNTISVVSGCAQYYLPIALSEDKTSFTLTLNRRLVNYLGEQIDMEVIETFTRVTE